jgi:uncharacterized protein (TIGR02466 family)
MPASTPSAAASARDASSDPAALFARAEELSLASRHAEAEAIYRQLLTLAPREPAVLHNLGLGLLALGRLDEAQSMVMRAIEADPGGAVLHNSLGAILRGRGRAGEAERAFRKAIELWREYPEAHFNLGLALESLGRTDEALAAYREAVEIQPAYAQALVRAGGLLVQRGDADAALAWLERAVTVAPELFDVHYYRGWTLSALGRHADALAALDRAEALEPGRFEVAQARANALRDAGRRDEALDAYWRLLELRPDRYATHEELNKLAWSFGREDLFLKSFAHARERRGEDAELLQMQAAFHLRRRQFAQAEQLLRRARAIAPGREDVTSLLARTLAGQGRFEESYPLFLDAIGAAPGIALHRQEFALALLRDRQPVQAKAVLETALQAFPLDQILIAALIVACRATGDARATTLLDCARYVRVYDLAGARGSGAANAFNQALARELDALHHSKVEPIDQTLRGGTQTIGRLFDARAGAIAELRERIRAAVADYIRQLPANTEHPAAKVKSDRFGFSGSWSCRLASGGFHDNHVHPRGWISSAYYARLPGALDDAQSRAGWLKFGESALDLGGSDTPIHFIRPAVGRLVLFPSFFWHGTVPFRSDADRLSVAFDVVPEPAITAGAA